MKTKRYKLLESIFICLILTSSVHSFSQNHSPISEKDQTGNLIGITSKESLLELPYNKWFNPRYKAYQINEANLKKMKSLLVDVNITVFMATWCKASIARVPIFLKILDVAEFDYKNLKLIAVNRRKKTPDMLEKGYTLIRVPTFIFYKNGKELGRVVESPRKTIEKDIIKILSGKPYKHRYFKK